MNINLEAGKAYRTTAGHRAILEETHNYAWPFKASAEGTPYDVVYYTADNSEECNGSRGERLPDWVIVSEWSDTPQGGGFAFPSATPGNYKSAPGMTLRDWFAGQALTECIKLTDTASKDQLIAKGGSVQFAAKSAYAIADAMIAERSK